MFVPVVRKTFPNKITVFVSRFFLRDIPRRHLVTILRNKVSRSLSTRMQTFDDINTHVRMCTLASAIPEILRSLQRFRVYPDRRAYRFDRFQFLSSLLRWRAEVSSLN
jgi:hypothetical protein